MRPLTFKQMYRLEQRTAYHEAGHAVMETELRQCTMPRTRGRWIKQVKFVTIRPWQNGKVLRLGKSRSSTQALGTFNLVMVLFAGMVAEHRFAPRVPWFDLHEGARSDLREIDHILKGTLFEGDRDRIFDATTRWVKKSWNQISAVAEALLEYKTLTGAQVVDIMEKAA